MSKTLTHIVGTLITIDRENEGTWVRQLCMWCGTEIAGGLQQDTLTYPGGSWVRETEGFRGFEVVDAHPLAGTPEESVTPPDDCCTRNLNNSRHQEALALRAQLTEARSLLVQIKRLIFRVEDPEVQVMQPKPGKVPASERKNINVVQPRGDKL